MNAAGLSDTLEALGGRVTGDHAALVALCVSLAQAVDLDPGNASLAREYRGALSDLMEATADGGVDELERLFAELDRRAQVGDASV